LSLEAFPLPKRKISESRFSYVEPLKPTIWDLFDTARHRAGKTNKILPLSWGYGRSFATLLTRSLTIEFRQSEQTGRTKTYERGDSDVPSKLGRVELKVQEDGNLHIALHAVTWTSR
jgi:hypothetical protein